jgi:hypothetical protein
MKNFYLLIALLLFADILNAQTNSTPDPTATAKFVASDDGETKKKHPPLKIGNVPVPPEKAYPINIPKIGQPLIIDGKIDEEIWKDAAVFKDFIQTGPGDNVPVSKPTEVYMIYDEKHLYIAFKCWDEKDKIRATMAKRDNVFGEDNVRIWLDTYNDQRRAYVLGFNPLGIQQDGIFTEGQGADFSVDIVMESKGVIEDWGWSVEVKIPFKSLRYTAGAGKFWGFNAARNIDRFNDEFDQWLPDDRNVSGFLIKSGKITGLDGIKYERTLEVAPSVTISESGRSKRTLPNAGFATFGRFDPIFNPIGLQDPGRFVNDPIKYDIGVNLKYTISPNVTLDAAINPDYAEIEADAPVVTANQRFPIFFEEKRPFFLEGKDIFNSPLSLFYSRTIIDPDVAVKLSGKTGKTTFGFLAASDNAPGNYSEDERGELFACQTARQADPIDSPRECDNEEFLNKNAFFGVLRLKQDLGKEDYVGFFATSRVFPQNRNFAGGFDGSFKLNPATFTRFQVVGTHSKKNFYDPVEDDVRYRAGNGFGYSWLLDYTTDRHGWTAEIFGRTKDYRADAGFTRRTDTNRFFFANRFSTKSQPKKFLIRANFNQFARYDMDWKGRVQGGLIGGNANFTLQGSLWVYSEAGMLFEKIYEEEFGAKRNSTRSGAFVGEPTRSARQPYFSVNLEKNVNKQLFIYGFVGSIFNAIDYDFGSGQRYPRASPAFESYLVSPEYQNFLTQLYAYQINPVGVLPDAFEIAPPPGLDPGTGYQFDAEFGGEYKPVDPLRISLNYRKSRLKREDSGKVAFDSNLFQIKSTYQFSRFTFVRARLDYDSIRRNYGGQFLVGWNPNPGTAFYVGYNDTFNYSGFNPHTGQHEPGFARNNRTFFIRASYLFRKSF